MDFLGMIKHHIITIYMYVYRILIITILLQKKVMDIFFISVSEKQFNVRFHGFPLI